MEKIGRTGENKKYKLNLVYTSSSPVNGYRMAWMMKTDMQAIADAGYKYDSSINPTLIPGRYNNWHLPRTFFIDKGVLQLPASVSPLVRIPLFWLSLHIFPFHFYTFLCRQTLNRDGTSNLKPEE